MKRHPDTEDVRRCLNKCLAILRRNATTPPEQAGWFHVGSRRAVISRADTADWHEQIAAAQQVPSLWLSSKESVVHAILETLLRVPDERMGISRDDADTFCRKFAGLATEHTVQRPVWGLSCNENSTALQLGSVTVFNRETYRLDTPLSAVADLASANAPAAPRVWAAVTVAANDHVRAIELANVVFERLEAVLNFALPANGSQQQVSILSPSPRTIGPCRVDSKAHSHFGVTAYGVVRDISIDDPLFRSPSVDLSRLLTLVTRSDNESALRMDLFYAVQWCSKSRTTDHAVTAFIQATIAIEVVLGSAAFGKGGISGRIAVNSAHLLGNTVERSDLIEARVAKCYRMRSQCVHGGSEQHPDVVSELRSWQEIVTQVILRVFALGEKKGLTCIEQVAAELRSRTYRYKGAEQVEA